MPLYSDISPQTLTILSTIIALAFIYIVYVVFHDIYILEKGHEALDHRVQKLRLGNMIAHLNIPFNKYDHKTSDLDKERHIWRCEHCHNHEECERMFKGENINPATFCPNYRELDKIKGTEIN